MKHPQQETLNELPQLNRDLLMLQPYEASRTPLRLACLTWYRARSARLINSFQQPGREPTEPATPMLTVTGRAKVRPSG